jgi:hypothetical protein
MMKKCSLFKVTKPAVIISFGMEVFAAMQA